MRLTAKFALVSGDEPVEFFGTVTEANDALAKYQKRARDSAALGVWATTLPWAAVVKLAELSGWEMTLEDFNKLNRSNR